MKNMPTLGQIAKELNVPVFKVQYLIKARGIKPIGRAGNIRVFGPEAVKQLRSEIDKMPKRDIEQAC